MTVPLHPTPEAALTVEALLADLERAVAAGDGALATTLERLILQRLFQAAVERDALERRTRELMAMLAAARAASIATDEPTMHGLATKALNPRGEQSFSFDTELGATKPLSPRAGQSSSFDAGPGAEPRQDAAPNGGVVYPVWFATNRRRNALDSGYGGERGDSVSRGRVDVFVPDAHRFGETGTGFFGRLKRLDLSDDRLRVQAVTTQERDAFFSGLKQAMAEAPAADAAPDALVFIHGFRTTFEDAALRAAQIGFDLGVAPGGAGFFSWPSKGELKGYPADEASIEASERAIADFLVDFAANCGARKAHLIAHSMGNRGLLRALQRIAASAAAGTVKFGQIFLAAPDLDRDLFLDLAHLYPTYSERTTLYASDRDLPVHLSSKLHDAPRAGYFTPYTVAAHIDTVCVPDFDVDLLGHGYFAQAEALLYDIGDLMRSNQSPPRQRIAAMVEGDQSFWRIKR